MGPEKLLHQRAVEYSTLYVDMNSFFASVEQYYRPELRNRPVAVCAGTADTCTVLAASIEAKRFGVRTGTKVGDAKKMCPNIMCTNGDHKLYRIVHREFMSILHNTTCYVEARGIDEAFMKLPSWSANYGFATKLAKEIKAGLRDKYSEHVLCSIGIAPNIWLAKMAAGCHKPNGLTVISSGSIPKWLNSWHLRDLTGINRRMAMQFGRHNIYRPIDIYNASYGYLRQVWGVNGTKWYLRMRGVEVDQIKPSENKMLGHQITTLPNAPQNQSEITTFCVRIATTLGKRLRRKQLYAHYLGLHILYIDFSYNYLHLKTSRSFYTDGEIISYCKLLLKKLGFTKPVRKISLHFSELTGHFQPDLPLELTNSKLVTASDVSDSVNNRFDGEVLLPASSFFARHIQLDRVGFGGDQVKESYKYNIR